VTLQAAKSAALILTRSEELLARLLPHLEAEGFSPRVVTDPLEFAVNLRPRPSVVVLDVAVGRPSVRELCEVNRAASGPPILVLSTAEREDSDLVDLLGAGADDYLNRSERTHELIARVRALLRRVPEPVFETTDRVEVGDVVLDRERHVVLVADHEVHVPLKQFQLLELLLSNPGRVLTRDRLLRHVWGLDGPHDSNTLEVQVKRLREAIEDDPRHPSRIQTVRGLGYMYASAKPSPN
jgi:two-component system response regulator RegX3